MITDREIQAYEEMASGYSSEEWVKNGRSCEDCGADEKQLVRTVSKAGQRGSEQWTERVKCSDGCYNVGV